MACLPESGLTHASSEDREMESLRALVFQAILARTPAIHRAVDPVAYDSCNSSLSETVAPSFSAGSDSSRSTPVMWFYVDEDNKSAGATGRPTTGSALPSCRPVR